MAGETLRDLVVSLSLDSDNFSRNIKTVNALIREMESEFQLAAAGMRDFENSTAGQAAKLELLRSKYSLQEKAVAQFAGALQTAENKLTGSRSGYEKTAQAMDRAGEKVREAAKEVELANQRYLALSKGLGASNTETQKARQEWEQYKEALKDARKEQSDLKSKLDRAAKSMQNNADAVSKAQTSYNKAEAALVELRREMALLESGAYKAGIWFTNLSAEAEIAGRALESTGRFLTRYITTPLAVLGASSIKASIDFETAFTGVRKTVDATETQYRQMAASIKQMSGEVADEAKNIASVVATAGQLGIANDYIMEFTRTVQDLTVSTEDLKGTQAAEEIARFANVAQMSQKEVANLGSALAYLGNNYATTEGAIMEMALNIAAAGKQVGLTEAQILGFAAGLSSVGLEAEKGGTAMSKSLKKMEVAAETGGEALADFAQISGMAQEQFRAVWEKDPAQAFMAFIEGLSRMDDEGISAIATMQEIGLSEVRLSDTILRTVNAQELFNSALSDSARAWQENTALAEESDKFYATTESRLKNLGNRAKNFGARLGDSLNPQLEALMGVADNALASLEELDSAQIRTITRIAGWAAAIGPLSLGMGKFTLATGDASKGIGKFLKSIAEINASAKATNTSFLSVASSTLGFKAGIAGLSVAVIAGAAALAYYTSNAYKTKKAIESMQDTVNDWKNSPADTLFSGEGMSFFGLDAMDFTGAEKTMQSMEEWRDELIKVWTDGQKETDAIVQDWTDSFTQLTDHTRQQLQELKTETGGENSFIAGNIDKDIDALDELDREIAALLKKRQNRLFTEDDLKALQNAMDRREAIVVKYSLQEATGKGYEEIARGINDEINRAALEGRSVDFSVYEEGTLAAAQGYALITQELEKQYDIQRQILETEGDQEALSALDEQYLHERTAAAREYLATMRETAAPIFESEDAEKAKADMDEIIGLLEDYQTAGTDAEKASAVTGISNLLKDMDKDALVEYIALVQQVRDAGEEAGLSEERMEQTFGEGYEGIISSLGSILDYLDEIDDKELSSLDELFGDVVLDEVKTINVELNRDDLAAQIDEFSQSPEAVVELKAVINPTGMDAVALDNFIRNNEVEVTGRVTLGSIYDNPRESIEDQTARFFGPNGIEIPVSAVSADDLTEQTLVLLSEGENGVIERNVIITMQAGENAPEEILNLLKDDPMEEAPVRYAVPVDLSTLGRVEDAIKRIRDVTDGINFWEWLLGYGSDRIQQSLDMDFGETEIGEISAYIADVYARLKEGGEVTEDEIAALKTLTEFLSGLDALGVGTDIINEVQGEMTEAGWTGTAEEIDSELSEALKNYVDLQGAGAAMMDDLAEGMMSNLHTPISAAAAARRAIAAALNPTGPASYAANPTGASEGSYMGKVGGTMMESLGLGALKEAPNQAKIIGNAARYISGKAGEAMAAGGGSYAHTYNQQQTVNLTGNSFYVRSEQDVYQLAYETAAIMKRRQKGYGG